MLVIKIISNKKESKGKKKSSKEKKIGKTKKQHENIMKNNREL